mgnify:CR=1 FL=1
MNINGKTAMIATVCKASSPPIIIKIAADNASAIPHKSFKLVFGELFPPLESIPSTIVAESVETTKKVNTTNRTIGIVISLKGN